MNYATTLLPQFNRKEYKGRSDKYIVQPRGSDLEDTLKQISLTEIAGSTLNDSYVQDSAARLARYVTNWKYYTAKHFEVEYDGGFKKTPVNFCRSIVNKRASWVAGKGFSLLPVKGNEFVSDLYYRVWASNGGRQLIRRTNKQGQAYGDAFWYFTVKTKDRQGNTVPRNQWRVEINQINPCFCFPIWQEDNPKVMAAFMMQFPIVRNGVTIMYVAIITPSKITLFEGSEKKNEFVNPLGIIPVVHLPSNHCGDALFGSSILEDIIPLNDAYNETVASIRKIIRYHGEPTTLVFGARLSTMERGANKVWSNLPPPSEAKVENLEMKGNLEFLYKQLEILKESMYEIGRTPAVAYESKGVHISNSSGIALQLLFQPLVEASMEEQDTYAEGIKEGNRIIRQMHLKYFGEDILQLADDVSMADDIEVIWNSMLPKDEQAELDMASKRIEMGIWSKAEAVRRLSGVRDTQRLATELLADNVDALVNVAEKQRALNGQNPVLSSAALSSIFISEDLVDMAKKIGDLTGDASDTAVSGE